MSHPEVVKYQDPKSVLVVGQKGRIAQLYCPFRVQCIQPLEQIPKDTWVYVEGVFLHPRYKLTYWINRRLYPYQYFRIELFH